MSSVAAVVFVAVECYRFINKYVLCECVAFSYLFLSGQSLVADNNPVIVEGNVTINCTTAVVSAITLRFNGDLVNPSTNPRVTVSSQTAFSTIYTFANVTKSDNGLNISCTIPGGGNAITLGHTILDVQCEFVCVICLPQL